MTKKKSNQEVFNKFMSNLVKQIGLLIQKKINMWKEKYDKKKKFDKEIKSTIKKNQMYAKGKKTKRYSLTRKGDIY